MILGYNTNGFAHHRLSETATILAELGYRGIALTPDVHHLDPFSYTFGDSLDRFSVLLESLKMACAIETGARFLLNPRKKHHPTLLDPETAPRKKRFAFLSRCIEMSAQLKATCVSFWSGAKPMVVTETEAMKRLAEECRKLSEYAATLNVRLAFEPEPGMFIDTMPKFEDLFHRVNHPNFGLTLDVGHLVCMGETPIEPILHQWKHVLWNLHLDDMNRGVHDHLIFGEGQVNFPSLLQSLKEISFDHIGSVELSRHSHDAVNTAKKSMIFFKTLLKTKRL
jgi:L-ribulose-5-phosphate 3-epimerase